MKTTKTITKQNAFNKVWQHFVIDKNPPGYDSLSGVCTYRNKEGNRCAIGLLLSDDEINFIESGAEENAGFAICLEEILETSLGDRFEDKESYFWLNLQEAHDFSMMRDNRKAGDFTTNIERWLVKTAVEYNLSIPK